MEPRRLSGRSARALRRVPHAAESRPWRSTTAKVRRRGHRRAGAPTTSPPTKAPASAAGATTRCSLISQPGTRRSRHGGRPDGRSRRPKFQPDGAVRHPGDRHLSAQRSADRLARSAGAAGAAGAGFAEGRRCDADPRGKKIFEGSCVSCHGWTGVSPITPYATLTGARAVNDPTATNVAQIVISGSVRHTPRASCRCRRSAARYSDTEIAAVSNYVTARFGSARSSITDKNVAGLRSQTAR